MHNISASPRKPRENKVWGAVMNNKIEIFGNYVLLQKLASGGMAEVFLARPAVREGDGRLLVIKRILPHIANHTEFINMFQREIQIIMGFTHAHVVQLHDFGTVNGQPYIAMEYIEGKSLRDIAEKLKSKNVRMPVPVALSVAAQAASGLHYAHTFLHKTNGKPLNTIHRDVSPHNLILSYDGNLKVIDFGIAKAAGSVHDLTQTGTIKGKAGYFSPEQLTGQNIDARSDIFSLGVVAWELLAGEKLFAKPGESEINVMVKVSQCEKHVLPPSGFNKDITPEIDRLILKALEKDPARRFRDAREFQGELRKVLMRYYPAYQYADTGQLVSVLFAEDMKNERRQTNELNTRAQSMIVGGADDKTTAIDVASLTSRPVVKKLTKQDKTREEVVAFRLSKIEAELKQKATGRHYLMLAVYVVSLFVIKFGDRYNYWIDFSTQKARASEMAQLRAPASIPAPVPAVVAKPAQPVQAKTQITRPATRIAAATSAASKLKKNLRPKTTLQQ
jgi:eukaryotic-like serine/threonine-protein kinase